MADISNEDLLVAIKELSSEVKEVKTDLSGVKTEVKEIKADLTSVRAEVKEIKTDLTSVKTEMQTMKTELKQDIQKIDHKLKVFIEDLGDARADISILKHEIN